MTQDAAPGSATSQFAITFAAALFGSLAALALYDALVVQPRAAIAPVPSVDLSAARITVAPPTPAIAIAAPGERTGVQQDAKPAAAELAASIHHGVADARATLDAQADEQERRRLAVEALHRADGLKVAMAEAYQSNGQWPANLQDIGMGAPDSYAGGAVAGIAIDSRGVITVTLNEAFAAGAKILLVPTVQAQTGMVSWQCRIDGPDELRHFLPACREAQRIAR